MLFFVKDKILTDAFHYKSTKIFNNLFIINRTKQFEIRYKHFNSSKNVWLSFSNIKIKLLPAFVSKHKFPTGFNQKQMSLNYMFHYKILIPRMLSFYHFSFENQNLCRIKLKIREHAISSITKNTLIKQLAFINPRESILIISLKLCPFPKGNIKSTSYNLTKLVFPRVFISYSNCELIFSHRKLTTFTTYKDIQPS